LRIGSLTPGKQADLIMIRTDDISLFPCNDAAGTVVHAAERRQVDTVMVAGRFRKRDGRLLNVDFAKARKAAEVALSHLFQAGDYDPDPLEEQFPDLVGEKPAAWMGS
jgi:5-methylthioadenosine/S-adenosylhomocysteine deaminase